MLRNARGWAWLSLCWLAVAVVPGRAEPPVVQLTVDLTDAARHLLHARMSIPAQPGPLTVCYPRWNPGDHRPSGPLTNLIGPVMSAGGQQLAWRRDSEAMDEFRCDVPAGVGAVDVDLRFEPLASYANLVMLQWSQVLLYPQGTPVTDLRYAARLKLPAGWRYGTALSTARTAGDTVEFEPVSLVTLIDSPVFAGRHLVAIPLAAGTEPPHELVVVSENPRPEARVRPLVPNFERLIAELHAVVGTHHFRHYHFLVALAGTGSNTDTLEHHESTAIRVPEHPTLDDVFPSLLGGAMAHEYVHSWNGKFRRPAGMITTDYQQPQHTEMLWLYEGLTEYYGRVLAVRSGLASAARCEGQLASLAAFQSRKPARAWCSLRDSAINYQNALDVMSRGLDWAASHRDADVYDEMVLVWLEVDTLLRKLTDGQRSLDDFLRLLCAGENGPPMVVPTTFEDVVGTLNQVAPHDWAALLNGRLDSTAPETDEAGITAAGWRLVYDPQPFVLAYDQFDPDTTAVFRFSLGLLLKPDGTIEQVMAGQPAERARLGVGMKVITVNHRRWSVAEASAALKAGLDSKDPLTLLVSVDGDLKTFTFDYHGGERYPHLERIPGQPDGLAAILSPKVPPAAAGAK
ncbi:MAG: M61 family metallopeptidase [Armatimonadetes bacterium]|nr:M61 family metallopeptidase [Armatimonadota bacterium]